MAKSEGSLRCTLCAISWPALGGPNGFNPCPSCGDVTFPIHNHPPEMTREEAFSMKRNFEFDRFYEEEWDALKDPKRLRPTADDRVRFPFDPELAEK